VSHPLGSPPIHHLVISDEIQVMKRRVIMVEKRTWSYLLPFHLKRQLGPFTESFGVFSLKRWELAKIPVPLSSNPLTLPNFSICDVSILLLLLQIVKFASFIKWNEDELNWMKRIINWFNSIKSYFSLLSLVSFPKIYRKYQALKNSHTHTHTYIYICAYTANKFKIMTM